MVRAMGLFSKRMADLTETPPEAAEIVEQLTEMFPQATVTVNEPVEVSLDELRHGADRISQLERLAKLRDQGALTDSEFQAEKARILGEG
jgi:hypothetical protein